MKIINIKAFEGRNIYSHRKCIRMDVDLEGYCEIPSKDIEGFNFNLVRLLPELSKHRCGIDEDGGFITRLKEGTYLAHICEHAIIAIQNILGIEVSYGKARVIKGDRYYIIYQYEYKETAIMIGKMAVDLVNSLIRKSSFNFDERIKEVKVVLNSEQMGPSTGAICDEAKKAGIPVTKLGDTGLYQLGFGKYGHIVNATICEETSSVAVDISCDKLMTKKILNMHSIPVAKGGVVRNSLELLFQAEALGYPVVLKPQCGNQGKGVFVNIKNEKELLSAYTTLCKSYKETIIEKYITGRDYRVCVVNGELVAAALRIPPYVVGDGKRNVKELIRELNCDPRRGEDHEKALTKVKIDDELLICINRQGYNLSSVPGIGYKLILRGNANLSTGGSAIDCTDEVCEENRDIFIRAAKAVGLNICGIDVCCEDIAVPLYENNGAIVEINAAPGIRMHHYPSEGKSRNVAKAIVDMMFKDMPKTIPVVSITGTNGKTTTTRLIGYTLSLMGYNVGMTTTGGIYINNKCIENGDTTGPESAMTVLLNKEVDAAVLETARGGIIRSGLAYDLADVAVITNITEDHLGIDGVETIEELAKVKSLVVEAVKDDGYAVLNADDPVTMSVAERVKSSIILFSRHKENEMVRNHIDSGGCGVYCDGGYICAERGNEIVKIVAVSEVGITLEGKLQYNIENALAACSALIGLDVDYYTIAKGLTTFYCNEDLNPGRFNLYNIGGATVILDYGHNIEGYKAVLEGAKKIKHNRLIGIIGVPGDRLDSNIIDVGSISGKCFDYIFVKEDKDRRGRKKGEVAELLIKGVSSTGFNSRHIETILDEKEALEKAINQSMEGDLIIIFFEKYEPLLKLVKEKMSEINEAKEIMA